MQKSEKFLEMMCSSCFWPHAPTEGQERRKWWLVLKSYTLSLLKFLSEEFTVFVLLSTVMVISYNGARKMQEFNFTS